MQPYDVFRTRLGGNTEDSTPGQTVAATNYSTVWSAPGGGFGLHLEWTGTPTGNVQLWFSTKPAPSLANDNDWTQDATFGTSGNVALGGAAGKYGDNVGNAKARLWRFKLSGGGGSGVIFGWVTPSAE